MEVLQGAFWSLEPERTVLKFAGLAGWNPAATRRGASLRSKIGPTKVSPCRYRAAAELLEGMFAEDQPGRGRWQVGGRIVAEQPPVRSTHLLAGRDVVAPAETAPAGEARTIAAGHVGMVVGSQRARLHAELASILGTPLAALAPPANERPEHP